MVQALEKNSVVAVIGSGAMGSGIAQVAAVAGHTVKLFDTRPEAVDNAIAGIAKALARLVEKGRMGAAEADLARERVHAMRALGLALLGDKLPAEKAEQWGLIWRCVADESLMDEALTLARHFATAPTKGLAFTKRAMQASWGNTLEQQLQLEAGMMRELGYSHDYREGVAAFIAKRPPQFKGE